MKCTENSYALPGNIAVLGPTGSGKTAVTHYLADIYNAEIVSCDSMQVYRGMNVGTDKPAEKQLQKYNYHMIGMLDIHQSWNLQQFLNIARPLIRSFNQQNKTVILTGGTGLYAKALLYNYQLQAADSLLYEDVYKQTQSETGKAELIRELEQGAGNAEIPNSLIRNPRRLARAVEILRLEGHLPKKFGNIDQTAETPGFEQFQEFVLLPEPAEHRSRIHQRTWEMLNNGWLEETDRLLQRGLMETSTAKQVLGYSEVAKYLQGELVSFEELVNQIEKKTWQYARRQKTWFRNQHPQACLLTLRSRTTARQIAAAIASTVASSHSPS